MKEPVAVGRRVRVIDVSALTGECGEVIARLTPHVFRVRLDRRSPASNVFAAYQLEVIPSLPVPPVAAESESWAGDRNRIYMRTLSASDVATKQFSLPALPRNSAEVLMHVRGIGLQFPVADFVVAGPVLRWDDPASGCHSLLVENDLLAIIY